MSKIRDSSLHEEFQDDISTNICDDETFTSSSRTTEQAKEEAMKLLKSGAISFDTGNERHIFKRKLKESDSGDSEDIPELGKGRKLSLYDNFVAGDRINPIISSPNKQKSSSSHDGPSDSHHDSTTRNSLHRFGSSDFEGEVRKGMGGSTIYISFNNINEANVREILEPYGPILNIRIDEKKCYGFVTLKSHEIAEKALQLDRTRFNNNRLRVNYARRQHRIHDGKFENIIERSSLGSTPRGGENEVLVAMFCHLVVRWGCRFPHLLNTFRTFSTKSSPVCVDVYVSADRTKFYRSLGLFCLAQGSVWLALGQYLLLMRDKPVTWEVAKRDACEFTRLLVAKLQSWMPDAVDKVVFQSNKAPQMEENVVKAAEVADARVNGTKNKETKTYMESRADRMSRATTEEGDEASQKERAQAKQLVPYLCFIMGAFTLFVGGFVPRRVIRRVSLFQWKSAQDGADYPNNPMMRVNTYGWFGLFPRRGALFAARMNNIRATAEYREGNRFMNLIIVGRPFAFYLERLEAEFALPEYFELLNSKAFLK
ncbi:unnamed protein product [Hydatigera taeniaeformis]|uniref:RRM domain-containing protein n=1 Tax=Hydatigena taeniaeformis TaxID=6205 RepID=A0A0R3X130_HYDTA|nr:unnamed protein product [Hydatigera taeniaeformis]